MTMQVARSGAALPLSATPAAPPIHRVTGSQVLITGRPAARAAELAAAGVQVIVESTHVRRTQGLGHGVVTVLDSVSWLSNPALWNALTEGPVLIDACSFGEFRQLSRRSAPPPPLADLPDRAWLLLPECEPERIRLPQAASAASTVVDGSP
jgi:S-DNA-T family DNA segregation ATPase FtsK/SpoIIIE